MTPSFFEAQLAGPRCDPCAESEVNGLDRAVVHFDSKTADRTSDAMVVLLPALAYGASLFELPRWGWRGVGEDWLLLAQSMAVTGAIHRVVSLAVRRPRPFMYRPGAGEPARHEADATLSFFSGHTADSFAVAAAVATIYGIRRPRSALRPLVWVGALLLASVVPICRVGSGEHFWSDVLVGAAVGATVGYLVPTLHRRRSRLTVGAGPGGLAVSGAF